jgi:hypothetical protein
VHYLGVLLYIFIVCFGGNDWVEPGFCPVFIVNGGVLG